VETRRKQEKREEHRREEKAREEKKRTEGGDGRVLFQFVERH
jgi:hypothetical protein